MSQVSPEPLAHDAFCPHCGYNLRGLSILRCPECGKESERSHLQPSPIPWLYRKQAGRVGAFFRTLWLTTFHPLELTRYLDQEIAGPDARRFRWVCTVLLAIPLAVAWGTMPAWATPVGSWTNSMIGGWLNGQTPHGVWGLQLFYLASQAYAFWPFCVLLGLAMAWSISVFFVRLAAFLPSSSSLREVAITRANYLVGSLLGGILVGIPVGIFLAALFLLTSSLSHAAIMWDVLPISVAVLTSATAVLAFAMSGIQYFRTALILCQSCGYRILALAGLLIGLWVVFWLMLLPLCVGLFLLFYRSLS